MFQLWTRDGLQFCLRQGSAWSWACAGLHIIRLWDKLLLHWEDNPVIRLNQQEFDLFWSCSCLQGITADKLYLSAFKYEVGQGQREEPHELHTGLFRGWWKCSDLGNHVIHWLCLKPKSSHVQFEEFLDSWSWIQKSRPWTIPRGITSLVTWYFLAIPSYVNKCSLCPAKNLSRQIYREA